jgi:hypothetical protein
MSAWSRVGRFLRIVLASLAIGAAVVSPGALAQTPNPNEAGLIPEQQASGGGGGDPWYGYAAWAIAAALGLFLVCKSARRAYTD